MKVERQRRRRTGTIARLPREVRDRVNEMLDDGCPYGTIVEWLAANGYPDVNRHHVGVWKEGGFQEYQRQQEQQRLAGAQEKVMSAVPPGLSDGGRAQIEKDYNL